MNELTRFIPIITVFTAITVLPGCAPMIAGGAVAGVSMFHERRTTATILEDEKIELVATARMEEESALDKQSQVHFTSYNRVLLITGQADSAAIKTRIVGVMSRISGVNRVVNQITLDPRASYGQMSDDIYLVSKIKLSLLDIKIPDFDPTRVKVVVECSHVHLMGLLTKQEAKAVVENVRFLNGVKRVTTHFEYVHSSS